MNHLTSRLAAAGLRSVRAAAGAVRAARRVVPRRCVGAVQGPQNVIGDVMVVQGWAWLGRNNEVASVLVTVDGVVAGAGELGAPSPDVASARPETKGSTRCSWRVPVDFGPYVGLDVVIGAFAITSRGVTQQLAPLRAWVAQPAEGGIDLPADQTCVTAGRVRVAGWALPTAGTLARVAVRVNGADAGSARPLASPRPDIAATRSEPAAPVAGFEHSVAVPRSPGDPISIEVDVVTCDGRTFPLEPVTVVADGDRDRPPWVPRSVAPARSGPTDLPTNGSAAVRLVVFTHRLDVGGGQLYLQDLLRALLPDPDLDCLVISAADGPLRAELETLGAQIWVTPFPVSTVDGYEACLGELGAVVRARQANVVLVNTMISGIGADLAARLEIPAVWVIRESFTLDDFWPAAYGEDGVHRQVRGAVEQALGRAAALVFEADATRAAYSPLSAPERALTIAHGVSLAPIDHYATVDRFAARRTGGFADTSDVVLNVGTIEPRKGQAALVLAFAEVADEFRDAVLVLVGDTGDAYATAVREMARRLRLDHRIRIEPVTSDPRNWYLVADSFVLASDVESLPRVLLEAMAFGLPVAATAVWGIPEVIADGENGLLFEPRDIGALVNVLRRLLTLSPPERRRLGIAAARGVRARHDPTTAVRAIGQLIRGFAEDASALPRTLLDQ